MMGRPKSVLLCHHNEPLNRYGLARWLASFTDLAAVVVIEEPRARLWRRIKREIERIGPLRFLDVLAFRFYYGIALAAKDRALEEKILDTIRAAYPETPSHVKILHTRSPNSAEVKALLHDIKPAIMIARCKHILAQRIFSVPSTGSFVMHPGICPEYRNAHGCFWALATRDVHNVGMTLLRVDSGVDTGPVYGYYRYSYDEITESHAIIQSRVVFDNLDALRQKFEEILAGTAKPVDTLGRKSQAWGQPWLTSYLRWKRQARRQAGQTA